MKGKRRANKGASINATGPVSKLTKKKTLKGSKN